LKRYAGPTPSGTYVTRTTPNDYGCAVAAIDTTEQVYQLRKSGERGYVPNPMLGQWISVSWHRTAALAASSPAYKRNPSRYVIVPVIEPDVAKALRQAGLLHLTTTTIQEENTMSESTEITEAPEATTSAPEAEATGVVTGAEKAPTAAQKKRAAAKAKAEKAKAAAAKAAKAPATPKPASKPRAKAASTRTPKVIYKSEAASEKAMKEHHEAYVQYQVERDKNRNERGMATHRAGYTEYKNAYSQNLAYRKAAGKGRRPTTKKKK
jgi:hypothetical protein